MKFEIKLPRGSGTFISGLWRKQVQSGTYAKSEPAIESLLIYMRTHCAIASFLTRRYRTSIAHLIVNSIQKIVLFQCLAFTLQEIAKKLVVGY